MNVNEVINRVHCVKLCRFTRFSVHIFFFIYVRIVGPSRIDAVLRIIQQFNWNPHSTSSSTRHMQTNQFPYRNNYRSISSSLPAAGHHVHQHSANTSDLFRRQTGSGRFWQAHAGIGHIQMQRGSIVPNTNSLVASNTVTGTQVVIGST